MIPLFRFSDFYSTLISFTKPFTSSFKIWAGPVLFLVVRDPDDIKIVLNSEETFDKIALFYKQYLSYCLFSMNGGDKYKRHKKVVSPLFHPASLQRCLPIINMQMRKFLKRFDANLHPGKAIECSHYAMDFILDTLLSTMFGIDDTADEARMKFVVDTEK